MFFFGFCFFGACLRWSRLIMFVMFLGLDWFCLCFWFLRWRFCFVWGFEACCAFLFVGS